jgi:ammonium transporter Rh
MPAALHSLFLVAEVILLVIYAFCTSYGEGVVNTGTTEADYAAQDIAAASDLARLYPFYQDVHVMIFVGFGFLMVFLKTHCWTSVGFNFIIACWAIQLNIIVQKTWHMILVDGAFEKIHITMESLITGDFAAAAVLITFGAILGKCTWTQLFVLATLEIIFFGLNETICVGFLGAVDMGGSMYVHTFGAYFGVAATFFFSPNKAIRNQEDRCSGSYQSNLVAMVGCLFLFMYWPSFNGALAYGAAQNRVVINTVLSITSSALTSCFMASIFLGKFDIEVMLNSTLAGGVAIGTACDLCMNPAFAIVVGSIAGIISAIGYIKLNAIF